MTLFVENLNLFFGDPCQGINLAGVCCDRSGVWVVEREVIGRLFATKVT